MYQFQSLSNQRVLITGHTGFKGSWLSLLLQVLGVETCGLSINIEKGSLFELLGLERLMDSTLVDIRNYDSLEAAVSRVNPTVIIHFAAQSLVLNGLQDPKLTFDTNIGGTVNLLECARRAGSNLRAVIIATSDKCYDPKFGPNPFVEDTPLAGEDPYSASKACAELIVRAYLSSDLLNFPCATVRAGNVIGGGDWSANRLIPDCVRAYFDGEPLRIRNPGHVRPWQHVLEPLMGYLLLTEQLLQNGKDYSGAWNFGSEPRTSRTVQQIAEYFGSQLKEGLRFTIEETSVAKETEYLTIDSSKATRQLGWSQQWNTETALKNTLRWYQQFYLGSNMIDFTKSQIYEYCEKLK